MVDLPDFWLLAPDALGGVLLPLLLLWLILALTAGYVAGKRGRGRFRWILIAVVLTPAIALPLLWSLRRLDAPQEHTMPLGTNVLRCPACQEVVSASLSRCSNCGTELPTDG